MCIAEPLINSSAAELFDRRCYKESRWTPKDCPSAQLFHSNSVADPIASHSCVFPRVNFIRFVLSLCGVRLVSGFIHIIGVVVIRCDLTLLWLRAISRATPLGTSSRLGIMLRMPCRSGRRSCFIRSWSTQSGYVHARRDSQNSFRGRHASRAPSARPCVSSRFMRSRLLALRSRGFQGRSWRP